MKMVEIFRTNIRNHEDTKRVVTFFLRLYPVYKINFDLEDEENIVRIETAQFKIETSSIIKYMTALGYSCERID